VGQLAKWIIGGLLALLLAALASCLFNQLPSTPPKPSASGCAYPGTGDPADPKNRPPTPATSGGWPTIGFRGSWTATVDPVKAGTGEKTFQWTSSYLVGGMATNNSMAGHAVIFRLEGNPDVTIVSIASGFQGKVSADGRSGYGCADANGNISVVIIAPSSAWSKGAARLWGIDENKGQWSGEAANFEVTPP